MEAAMAIRYRTNADQVMDELQRKQQAIYPQKTNWLAPPIETGTLQEALNRRGRKPSDNPKQLISLRLDPEVIEFFRATGDGWQTRINAELRKIAGLD